MCGITCKRKTDTIVVITNMTANILVKSWFGCGTRLFTNTVSKGFRPKEVRPYIPLDPRSSSHIKYLFVTFIFFPIFPLSCYRINDGNNKLIKKESMKPGEIIIIYTYAFLGIFIVLMYLLPAFFD